MSEITRTEKPVSEKKPTSPEIEQKSSLLQRAKGQLPAWFAAALTDVRKWKTFVRCMVATFATLVLLLVQSSLTILGQAAFFGLIMSQMLPPNMAISVYFLAFLTLIMGIFVGWAWGCAAMAAALSARSQVLLQEDIRREQSTYTDNANLDAEYQNSIFHGAFLDPRSSAIFGVFLFLGAYFFGWVRAKKPRLTLGAIFGLIILDLMCSFGPLFPIAEYTLANQLLLPASCYIAIALASIILIFPQTLHQVVLDSTIKLCLTPCLKQLQLQDEVLGTSPSDHAKWTELATKAAGFRQAHVAGTTAVGGQVGLLQLEISRSRMGPGELAKVFDKAKELGSRGFMLPNLLTITEERYQSLKQSTESPSSHPTPAAKQYQEDQEKFQQERQNLDALVPLLRSATAELRASSQKALTDAIAWLEELNHTRWTKPKADSPDITVREGNVRTLQATLEDFRTSKQFDILGPFREYFDAEGKVIPGMAQQAQYTARDLFRCYLSTTSLIYFAVVLVEFLEMLLEMEKATPKAKIQLPTKFAQMLVKSANDTSGGGSPLDTGTNQVGVDDDASSQETLVDEEQGKSVKKRRVYRKDPDAGEPKNGVQKFGRGLSKLWKAACSPAGLFALKQGLVSVALWIPTVCPSSAYFVYSNRGLWALIMAQTGMGVFTGEQIGVFILRMGGTITGLVMGMVAWYIGAGTGPGNPYGIAASTLIVGYGWVDEHVFTTANQGAGAALAGRRALLVIIGMFFVSGPLPALLTPPGFTAAFIVMLFPKPNSAKLIVRRTLARSINDISDLYAEMVSGVEDLAAEADNEAEGEAKVDVKDRQSRYRDKFLGILGKLGALEPQMSFAGLEPGLKGPWPKEAYAELLKVEGQIMLGLGVLFGAYGRLTPKWCRILAKRAYSLHPAYIADCLSLFSLLHQSLNHATPLPATIPIFERLAYHNAIRDVAHSGASQIGPSTKVGAQGRSQTADFNEAMGVEDGEDRVMERIRPDLSWDTLQSEQFALYCTATVGLIHVTNGLNQLQRIVVGLVGEKESGGLDMAQERWGRIDESSAI